MSVEIMSAVLKHAPVASGNLLILLILADYAGDDGTCWPSVSTLAIRGRMKNRNAQYCLQNLSELGLISTIQNAGPNGVNKYVVNLDFIRSNPRITGENGGGANFAGVQDIADDEVQSIAGQDGLGCNRLLDDTAIHCIQTTIEPLSTREEPLSSLRSDNGAKPDFAKALFDNGVKFLIANGSNEKAARSIIGKWRKDNSDEKIFAAFASAKKTGSVEPISYITKTLIGDENERLRRWGIETVNPRDFERVRNPGEPDPWDTKIDLSKVQPSSEICEQENSLPECDVLSGRGSMDVSSLRGFGGAVV